MVSALAKIHKAEELLTCGALAEQILHPPPPPHREQTNFLGVVYLRTAEPSVLFEPQCLGSGAAVLATTFLLLPSPEAAGRPSAALGKYLLERI